MQTKLLNTETYLLLVDEEAKIKKYGYLPFSGGTICGFCTIENVNVDIDFAHIHKQKLVFENNSIIYFDNFKDRQVKNLQSVIAYYPLTKEAEELDLPLLPEHDIEGFRVIQDKQFSLEDMLDVFEFGLSKPEFQLTKKLKEDFEKYVQSLSTQQLPVSFEPEYEPEYWGARNIFNPNSIDFKIFSEKEKEKYLGVMFDYHPKKLKTITNSECKEEIQGKYKF